MTFGKSYVMRFFSTPLKRALCLRGFLKRVLVSAKTNVGDGRNLTFTKNEYCFTLLLAMFRQCSQSARNPEIVKVMSSMEIFWVYKTTSSKLEKVIVFSFLFCLLALPHTHYLTPPLDPSALLTHLPTLSPSSSAFPTFRHRTASLRRT